MSQYHARPRLAHPLDVIPVVADAAARDARFPDPAQIATRQRVQRLDTGQIERWVGNAWVVMQCAKCGPRSCRDTVTPILTLTPVDGTTWADEFCYYRDQAELQALAAAGTVTWSGPQTGDGSGLNAAGEVNLQLLQDAANGNDPYARMPGALPPFGNFAFGWSLITQPQAATCASDGFWLRARIRLTAAVRALPPVAAAGTAFYGLPWCSLGWTTDDGATASQSKIWLGWTPDGWELLGDAGQLWQNVALGLSSVLDAVAVADTHPEATQWRTFVFRFRPGATSTDNARVDVWTRLAESGAGGWTLLVSHELTGAPDTPLWPSAVPGARPMLRLGGGFYYLYTSSDTDWQYLAVSSLDCTRADVVPVSASADPFGVLA